MASGDLFLKLESVEGESPDDKHPKEIQILSYSLGVSNAGTGAVGSGSGASKASFSDMSLTKYADNSSPNVFINCFTGKHHPTAILTVRKSGEKPQEYLVITMYEVFITNWSHSAADGGGLPMESFSLNFSKIKMEYKPQNPDGTLGAANPKTADIKKNVAS
jgi:type VI secretion system secreted protein Hcp